MNIKTIHINGARSENFVAAKIAKKGRLEPYRLSSGNVRPVYDSYIRRVYGSYKEAFKTVDNIQCQQKYKSAKIACLEKQLLKFKAAGSYIVARKRGKGFLQMRRIQVVD